MPRVVEAVTRHLEQGAVGARRSLALVSFVTVPISRDWV